MAGRWLALATVAWTLAGTIGRGGRPGRTGGARRALRRLPRAHRRRRPQPHLPGAQDPRGLGHDDRAHGDHARGRGHARRAPRPGQVSGRHAGPGAGRDQGFPLHPRARAGRDRDPGDRGARHHVRALPFLGAGRAAAADRGGLAARTSTSTSASSRPSSTRRSAATATGGTSPPRSCRPSSPSCFR